MKRFRRHKFSAKGDERDGQRFDSKKEARYYDGLKLLVKSGELLFFLRRVPFHIPGNVTYRVDFMEFYADGTIRFVDVKGFITKQYKDKKKIVESLYPVKIEEA